MVNNTRNNIKNIIVIAMFFLITSGFMLANIISPDNQLSKSERRKLAQAPLWTLENLFSGKLFEEYEKYFLDQFVPRDTFRQLKGIGRLYLLMQKDYNGIYIVDGNINKMEYPLDERSILNAAKKLNLLYQRYLQGMNVCYAVIPDKNYFVASKNGFLSMDYDRMTEILNQNVVNMKYIDLFESLTLDDYYKTDVHWSQDRIAHVADKLLKELGNPISVSDIPFDRKELYPFHGSYYGQSAIKAAPDKLVYLTNEIIENASVLDHNGTCSNVYMSDLFNGTDPYDVFLSGAKPFIKISNPACNTGRKLILFRDSFGNSIAPLLLPGYSEITMVDLRYMSSDLLDKYIDFSQGQDVLFLYSTLILNNSAMLK